MKKIVNSDEQMMVIGRDFANIINPGMVIELVGDVGAGKTTFVKGFALGLGISETIQSPTFTISRVYEYMDENKLCHYDFYRLTDAGVMEDELSEVISSNKNITIIEWSGSVSDILPADRVIISIEVISENQRQLNVSCGGEKSCKIIEGLK